MPPIRSLLVLALLLVPFPSLASPPPPLLLRNCTLVTVTRGVIEDGEILLRDGKIARIGRDLVAPEGAEVIDLEGRWVLPGIVDAHSHIGVFSWPGSPAHEDGNEDTDPITPQVRAMDAFDVSDPGIQKALEAGVTTIQVLPGSANMVGGQSCVVKLKPGRTLAEMLVPGAPPGMKMASGENPKVTYGPRGRAPSTRMGNFAVLREALVKTQDYMRKWEAWERGKGEKDAEDIPERDLRWEALAEVLRGKTRVHMHCYRADEILTIFRIADEFGFRVTALHHAFEAYKVAPEVARRGVGVATAVDWWGYKMEAWDAIPETPAILAAAGARVSIHSDSADVIQRLPFETAKAVARGLPREEAYRAFTWNPAWMIGLEDRIGSLEEGKDADIAVFTGDPLSVYSLNVMTIVDGEILFRRPASKVLGGSPQPAVPPVRVALPVPPSPPDPGEDPARYAPPAPDALTAIVGGRVFPVAHPPIEDGVLLLRGPSIEAVGPRSSVRIPPEARVVDATGLAVYPGFVDAYTALGMVEVGAVPATVDWDEVGPAVAHMDVRDAYALDSALIPVSRMGGVTSALTSPGTANVLGGQAGLFWLDGETIEVRTVKAPAGLLAGFGEPPKMRYGPKHQAPSTRMGIAATLRAALVGAKEYAGKWEAYRAKESEWSKTPASRRKPDAKEPEPPDRDLQKEALLPLLEGKLPLLARAQRLDDILTAIRIAEEFGLELVLVNAAEAWRIAPLLAEKRIPLLAGPVNTQPDSLETRGAIYENAAVLSLAGVEVALPSFGAHNVRNLRFNAGLAVAWGMPRKRAIEAITLAPARILGADDRIGSLRPGLSADLVIVDGDPLEPLARIRRVFIRGREIPLTSFQEDLAGGHREGAPLAGGGSAR